MSITISKATRLKIAPRVSVQTLGPDEGGVLLRLDSGELYTVNDTTLSFLQILDGHQSIADAARVMIETFAIDEETLTEDLIAIAGSLIGEKLVVHAA